VNDTRGPASSLFQIRKRHERAGITRDVQPQEVEIYMAVLRIGSSVGSDSAPACCRACCSAPRLNPAIGSCPAPYVITRKTAPIRTGNMDSPVSEGEPVVNRPRNNGRLKVQLSAHARGSIRGGLFLAASSRFPKAGRTTPAPHSLPGGWPGEAGAEPLC